jgi:hypothetical protein
VFGRAVALEGKRHVAGDQQQIARGDIDEMLVEVGDANDRRHPRARIACVPDAEIAGGMPSGRCPRALRKRYA